MCSKFDHSKSPVKKILSKTTVAVPITKRKKRGNFKSSDVNTAENAFTFYFEDFETKKSPNFNTVEDHVLWMTNDFVSKESTYWGDILQ